MILSIVIGIIEIKTRNGDSKLEKVIFPPINVLIIVSTPLKANINSPGNTIKPNNCIICLIICVIDIFLLFISIFPPLIILFFFAFHLLQIFVHFLK